MTATVRRLRPVPTIAVELDEGVRLRQAGQAGLETAQGADVGRPRWRSEIRDVQMMTRVAATLVEEVFRNLKALGDLYETTFTDDVGLEELAFQIHELKKAAEALQPN